MLALPVIKEKISRHIFFFIFLLLVLIIGFYIAKDFGETADDDYLQIYASRTIEVYSALITRGELLDPTFDNLAYYGPTFVTFAQLGRSLLAVAVPSIDPLTGWHIFIFLSFLVGVVALYYISLQLFPAHVSLVICLLYTFQPVLWGQGFLDAKDTPLMSSILLAVALGLRLEKLFPAYTWDLRTWKSSLVSEWKTVSEAQQKRIVRATRGFAIFVTVIIITSFFWQGWFTEILRWITSAPPDSWIARTLTSIAPNVQRLPLSGYASKALFYLNRLFLLLGVLWLFYLIALTIKSLKATRVSLAKAVRSSLGKESLKFWITPTLLIAALSAGIATAIRVVGPFAVVLVLSFLLIKKGARVAGLVVPYLILTAVTTYILWPFLWESPLQHYLDSINLMSNFPWGGRILFNGELLPPHKLPPIYLPGLLGIQLTVPAVVLIVGGFLLAIPRLKGPNRALIITLLLWFFIPIVYVIWRRPVMYHNFRQFLFIVPPLFVMTGFLLTWIEKQFKQAAVFWVIVLITILPGLVAIIQLHPYEYVYYNEFVGGLAGAQGRFEAEYWRTSFTEATLELNDLAPQNSLVVAWGSAQIVNRVARHDLQVETLNATNYDPARPYDYVIVPVRGPNGRNLFGNFPEIITISRLGVPFAVVNQLNCCAKLDTEPPSIFD